MILIKVDTKLLLLSRLTLSPETWPNTNNKLLRVCNSSSLGLAKRILPPSKYPHDIYCLHLSTTTIPIYLSTAATDIHCGLISTSTTNWGCNSSRLGWVDSQPKNKLHPPEAQPNPTQVVSRAAQYKPNANPFSQTWFEVRLGSS